MSSFTYKNSGVDIQAGEDLVKKISPMAALTKRAGVMEGLGGFGGLFDLKAEKYTDPVLVSGTDGVGTKLKIAIDSKIHHTVGIDLVAMCANDILTQGAQPLFFMDYFATGTLDVNTASEVIKGISDGCAEAGASLLGGETAEMPGFYPDQHYDLAGFCVGAVEREDILPQKDLISKGDILIGLPSSGFHSNGFSLIRKVLEHCKINFSDQCSWEPQKSIAEVLLEPTKIYVNSIMPLLDKKLIKAMAHITGGGLTENLPRIIDDKYGFAINLDSWQIPDCFNWVQENGKISQQEMLKTFNCGIGMVLVIAKDNVPLLKNILSLRQQPFYQIGHIIERTENDSSVSYQ